MSMLKWPFFRRAAAKAGPPVGTGGGEAAASTSKKPGLWLKEEDYLLSHRAFRRASDEREVIQRWMEHSPWLQFTGDEQPRILSIGCGSGEMDLPWMQCLVRRGRPFSYHALDPNRRSLDALQREAAVAGLAPEEMPVLHPVKFEDFAPSELFHRIVFMHSLYHFAERQAAVAKAAAMLAPNGRLLVCISDDAGLPALKAAVYRQVEMPAQSQTEPGSDLRQILASLSGAFQSALQTATARIDVTECLSGSGDGPALLDFLFLCRFSQLGETRQKVLLQELAAHSVPHEGRTILLQPLLFAEITRA
ncbi:MAG: class I SAM-dependent methyltransferase [Verrucomicrobiales bacterium]|nr:class I SAM-dependent methyltransferase [Verrucomicrobiales bacterium]